MHDGKKRSLFVANLQLLDDTGAVIFSVRNESLYRVRRRLNERLREKGLDE